MSHLGSKEVGLMAVLSPKPAKGGVLKNALAKNEDSSKEGFASLLGDSFAALDEGQKVELDNQLQKLAQPKEQKQSLNDDSLLNSFMQVLSLLELMQSDTKDIKLKNFANLFEKNNIKEEDFAKLAKAKDIKDLLSVAKKLDLNISKISFKHISEKEAKEFAKLFPKLAKRQFFTPFANDLAKKISTKHKNKPDVKAKPEQTPLSKLLSSLETASKIGLKKEVKIPSKEEESLVKKPIKKAGLEVKPANEVNIKPSLSTKDIKPANEIQASKANEDLQASVQNITLQKSTNKQEAQSLAGEKAGEKIASLDGLLKNNKSTKSKKKENLQEVHKKQASPQKDLLKELLGMNKKEEKSTNEPKESSNLQNDNTLHKDAQPKAHLNTFALNKANAHEKAVPLKQTLNHFANDLYEAAKEYKAPISRLNISLNPHNLGEVEVTLIQRGNNLHVSFASNSNTMQLFLANQAEFKSSLVNMGFGELQMSFSEKKDEGSQQEKGNQPSKGKKEDESEKSTLELEIAKYF